MIWNCLSQIAPVGTACSVEHGALYRFAYKKTGTRPGDRLIAKKISLQMAFGLRYAQSLLKFTLLGLFVLPVVALAEDKIKLPDIYMYQGQDREQRLIEGARKEGVLSLYTSMNNKDSLPIIEAFEKKYKIKVSMWRASGEKVVQRAVGEAGARRFTPDAFETTSIGMEILFREKLLAEFYSPSFRGLPAASFSQRRPYVADRFNFFTIAYNTNLVKPEDVPNTYQDLLNPRWAGQIGIEAGDSDWFAALVKVMGEKEGMSFFQKLSQTHPQVRVGHTLIGQLVAAGEILIAADIYNHGVESLAKKGAPIKWKAIPPTMGRPDAVGVASNAPHPHAALLFADFILSREGQELIKQRNRVPASKEVDTPLNKFPYLTVDPAITIDESEKWEKMWAGLFLRGQVAPKKEVD